MRLLVNKYLTYRARRIADRGWFERLLSWPWRPWVKRKVVVVDWPSRSYYVMRHRDGHHFIVCHPNSYERLRAAVDAQ